MEIGDDVTIGQRTLVHACTIEDRMLVGMGAIIMDAAISATRRAAPRILARIKPPL